ncbi:Sec-independent protein translocase protein TatB [Chitinimonas lacunae]|uniref:Sec-independent protein translocase protein TatB n=1 Tax=Chitinimonas lacunae TaxID=1963018 RepID=A0ABV8MSU2_9NEIS
MFEISFGEMLVVGAVALIFIGPEKLPKVARTLGAMISRVQRYAAGVKADIQREIELDNLRRLEAELQDAGRTLISEARAGIEPVADSLSQAEEASKQTIDQALAAFETPPPAAPPPRDRR